MIHDTTQYEVDSLRLLEFNRDAGGANPRRPAVATAPLPARAPQPRKSSRPTAQAGKPGKRLFPVADNTVIKPARRSPIDLEALQSRIHDLERRVRHHSGRIERHAAVADLETLQLRMQRLEQNLNSELWCARQREHTMLEMLSKPPLKTVVSKHLMHLWQSDIPAARHWLQRTTTSWWHDSQPGWWPRFAAAWQQSLDQARR